MSFRNSPRPSNHWPHSYREWLNSKRRGTETAQSWNKNTEGLDGNSNDSQQTNNWPRSYREWLNSNRRGTTTAQNLNINTEDRHDRDSKYSARKSDKLSEHDLKYSGKDLHRYSRDRDQFSQVSGRGNRYSSIDREYRRSWDSPRKDSQKENRYSSRSRENRQNWNSPRRYSHEESRYSSNSRDFPKIRPMSPEKRYETFSVEQKFEETLCTRSRHQSFIPRSGQKAVRSTDAKSTKVEVHKKLDFKEKTKDVVKSGSSERTRTAITWTNTEKIDFKSVNKNHESLKNEYTSCDHKSGKRLNTYTNNVNSKNEISDKKLETACNRNVKNVNSKCEISREKREKDINADKMKSKYNILQEKLKNCFEKNSNSKCETEEVKSEKDINIDEKNVNSKTEIKKESNIDATNLNSEHEITREKLATGWNRYLKNSNTKCEIKSEITPTSRSSEYWNKFRNKFESDHHWILRKLFLETHQLRFEEEKLLRLSQIFHHVQFNGCTYPQKLMDLIEELSQGIIDKNRKEQRFRHKRWVNASDVPRMDLADESESEKDMEDNEEDDAPKKTPLSIEDIVRSPFLENEVNVCRKNVANDSNESFCVDECSLDELPYFRCLSDYLNRDLPISQFILFLESERSIPSAITMRQSIKMAKFKLKFEKSSLSSGSIKLCMKIGTTRKNLTELASLTLPSATQLQTKHVRQQSHNSLVQHAYETKIKREHFIIVQNARVYSSRGELTRNEQEIGACSVRINSDDEEEAFVDSNNSLYEEISDDNENLSTKREMKFVKKKERREIQMQKRADKKRLKKDEESKKKSIEDLKQIQNEVDKQEEDQIKLMECKDEKFPLKQHKDLEEDPNQNENINKNNGKNVDNRKLQREKFVRQLVEQQNVLIESYDLNDEFLNQFDIDNRSVCTKSVDDREEVKEEDFGVQLNACSESENVNHLKAPMTRSQQKKADKAKRKQDKAEKRLAKKK